MGAKLQFVLDSVSLPFFPEVKNHTYESQKAVKTRKSKKGGSTGLKCGPRNVDPLGASQCENRVSEVIMTDPDLRSPWTHSHWALNPVGDKETQRGRPQREEDRDWSHAAKSHTTMACWQAVGQERVPNRFSLRPCTRNQPC